MASPVTYGIAFVLLCQMVSAMGSSLVVRKTAVASECGNGAFVVCKRCRELTQCIDGGGKGNDTEKLIKKCKENETCLSGTCSIDITSSCSPLNDIPFHCEQVGTFPDPADCKKYHICYSNGATLGHSTEICDVDQINGQSYGFDSKTGRCTIKLPGSRCTGNPVPLCKIEGEISPLPANPAYYYLCLQYVDLLYPVQMVCPYGGTYKIGSGCS